MLASEVRDDAAALILVRVRHPYDTTIHYIRASEYDPPRSKATDDGGTALCGEQATREDPFRESSQGERVCNLCHVRARPPAVVRPGPCRCDAEGPCVSCSVVAQTFAARERRW